MSSPSFDASAPSPSTTRTSVAPPPGEFDVAWEREQLFRTKDKGEALAILWKQAKTATLKNPFVPLGMAATVYALYGAIRSVRAGNSAQAQKFFRARVLAQGFAVLAIVGGAVYQDGIDVAGAMGTVPGKVKADLEKRKLQREQKAAEANAPLPPKVLPPRLEPRAAHAPPLSTSGSAAIGPTETVWDEDKASASRRNAVEEFLAKREEGLKDKADGHRRVRNE